MEEKLKIEKGFLNRGIDGDDRRYCVYVPF